MRRRILVWSLLGLLCAVPASAQNPNIITPSPQTAGAASSGACTRNTDCAVWDITNVRSVTLQVSGTFSGTLTFEGTTDGTNWVSIQLLTLSTGLVTTTTTTTGQFSVVNTGLVGLRARMTSYTSGTASVWAQLGQGGSIPLNLAGQVLPSSGCVSWNADTWLQRTAAGALGISGASCGGASSGTLTLGTLTFSGGQSMVGTTANVTELRNSTNAQTFNVYNTYTSATSYEQGFFRWSGNTLQIGNAKGSGGGTTRNVQLGNYDSGSTAYVAIVTAAAERWFVSSSGHLLASTDNTYDIGASGATRPRTIYAGTSVVVGTGTTITSGLIVGSGANSLTLGQAGGNNVDAVYLGSSPTGIVFNNAVRITSNATQLVFRTDSTHGFVVDPSTDGAIKLYARDGTTAGVYYTGATAGVSCASAGTVTSTNGIVTACAAPSPFMFPGLVILTQDEYQDFQAMRSAWRGWVR